MPRTDQETVIPTDKALQAVALFVSKNWVEKDWLAVLNEHLDTIFDHESTKTSGHKLFAEHLTALSAIQEHMMRAGVWQYKGMIRESIETRVRVGFTASERDLLRRLETGAHVIRVVVQTNERVMGISKSANEE
jgi:hypothetical protein